MEDEVRVAITSDADLVTARAEGRAMAERLGFPRPDPTLIATAISEVARNIVVHVGRGEIVLEPFEDANRYGVVVIADRRGARASVTSRRPLRDDYSGQGGLGLGLPGARRLMDDFEIASDADSGTTVTMRKWRFRDELARLREERRRRALSRRRESRSSGAWPRGAGPARRRAETSRSSRSCRRARWSPAIDGLGHGAEAARAARAGRRGPARGPEPGPRAASSSAATSRCGAPAARRSAWPSSPLRRTG